MSVTSCVQLDAADLSPVVASVRDYYAKTRQIVLSVTQALWNDSFHHKTLI